VPSVLGTGPMSAAVHRFLSANQDRLVDELIDWVRLPSVAGVAEHEVDLARSANWLAAALRASGFPSVEVWPVEGGPAVYAEWCAAAGAPTVLVYSHHDVRAAKAEQWEQTSPFAAVLRDGYVYDQQQEHELHSHRLSPPARYSRTVVRHAPGTPPRPPASRRGIPRGIACRRTAEPGPTGRRRCCLSPQSSAEAPP
jgi:hypothetical protein